MPNRSLHILLAEDNPINVKVATVYLSRKGHTIVVAPNGLLALTRLSEHPFDLVLMDVEMPGLDGMEATRRLRLGLAGERNRDIPVVAMTAHALDDAMESCLSAGMTGYLSKPLDFQALDAMLRTVVDASPDAAGNPPASSPSPLPGKALVLDPAAALRRLGDDKDLLLDVQNDFLRQYPHKLRLIAACRESENWEEAALAAHSLKNVAGAVGAEQVRTLAGRLEKQLHAADDLAVGDVLDELTKALTDADSAIRTWRAHAGE